MSTRAALASTACAFGLHLLCGTIARGPGCSAAPSPCGTNARGTVGCGNKRRLLARHGGGGPDGDRKRGLRASKPPEACVSSLRSKSAAAAEKDPRGGSAGG